VRPLHSGLTRGPRRLLLRRIRAPPQAITEVFAWISFATPCGGAAGQALAGTLAAGPGPRWGFIESAVGAGLADLQPLQAVAQASRPALQVWPGGQVSLSPQPARRADAGLLALLLVIRDAQRDGTWQRLKACGSPDRWWAFYDRSHSRASAWCEMATCGNRIKNRKLRQRQR
jgi:CGNR zinc finger